MKHVGLVSIVVCYDPSFPLWEEQIGLGYRTEGSFHM